MTMGHYERVLVFGGVYSNHLALRETLARARHERVDATFCLGDLGGFGPHPDKVLPLLRDAAVNVVRGNYDDSIGSGKDDCQCGYTDPKDNFFAALSYAYTLKNTGPEFRRFQQALPVASRFMLGDKRVLCVHGSPRRMNEFLWYSTSPVHFLEKLCDDHQADIILVTHTGLKWHRALPSGRHVVNVGVIGRPENDGTRNVWCALLSHEGEFRVSFVPVAYDHEALAAEMRSEQLPQVFIDTIITGWWTTCLEVMPAKERARGIW
jgi:predicted phosphodiesterase